MATECYSQLGFGFQPKLVVDFAGGTLTTDAGLLLVREFDEQLRLSADVVSRITDTRDPRDITHDLDALVRQRLYQIAAGDEDANDADRLGHDPTFQVVASDGRTSLGSQPTLSRLEKAIEWPAIQRLRGPASIGSVPTPTGPTTTRPISSSISTARTDRGDERGADVSRRFERLDDADAKRLRPKFMTMATTFIGLLPIMWATGTGSDVWKRIAAPMVGGIFTSFVLELVVYPVIYEIWKWHFELKRARAEPQPAAPFAALPSPEAAP